MHVTGKLVVYLDGGPILLVNRPTLKRWYAVWTNARQENIAENQLRLEGFETLLPSIRDVEQDITLPLFPRYLFVRFDVDVDRWRKIYSTQGVRTLLSSAPESPTPIPDPVIDLIHSGLPTLLVETEEIVIRTGMQVKVIRGHLKGKTGICSWTSKSRIKLMMDIIGGSVNLSLEDVALV